VGSQRFGGLAFNAFLEANKSMSAVSGWACFGCVITYWFV
jgi:hypothetical protein